MDNNIIFCEMNINDINNVSNMVNNVFDEFVGIDYSENGKKTFKDYIDSKNILERYNKTSNFYIAKCNDEIIGILEIKNKDHVSLFFVKREFHGKGIGKRLFDNYIRTLKQENNGIKTITVNSSFFAEKIYSKMGFIKIDEIQERDGIKYIPMENKL
jgi:predicted GNAT family N-acyltransferase